MQQHLESLLMAMPIQLARDKRPKRSEPRPLVETLPRLDIIDLCRWKVFPSQYDWHKAYLWEAPFRYPFIKSLVITLQTIEVNHHSEYNQIIPLRWCRTGFGGNNRPRPLFVCNCGRSVTKLYYQYGSLKCRRCTGAVHASQACSKRLRPILQAKRLQFFFEHKSGMWKSNRQRLKARLVTAPEQEFTSKRLAHHSILRPQRNHGTRGAMHWR
jgi:hypothetical protein